MSGSPWLAQPAAATPEQHNIHQDAGDSDHEQDQDLYRPREALDEQLVPVEALQHAAHVRHGRRVPEEAGREFQGPLQVVCDRERPDQEHCSEETRLRQGHGADLVLQAAVQGDELLRVPVGIQAPALAQADLLGASPVHVGLVGGVDIAAVVHRAAGHELLQLVYEEGLEDQRERLKEEGGDQLHDSSGHLPIALMEPVRVLDEGRDAHAVGVLVQGIRRDVEGLVRRGGSGRGVAPLEVLRLAPRAVRPPARGPLAALPG
eukprot:CAMPEP_0197935058 /NCGR_PEP_ID=MMETSP1439-20131203/112727_1 /TAXON_ID=66791 /ORGANISM="Gonyaulax spinifera, Strain CCMP409" /LENGTH=261 /DNA_ID=CAMNT_0043557979 /DNA_START=314 /DNA_END=1101 /DNA_ORIENTATION=+